MVNKPTMQKIVAKKTGKEPANNEKLITSRMSRLARRRENLLSAADQAKERAKAIRANPELSEKPAFASYANARRSKYYRDLAADVEKKRIGLKAGLKSKPNVSENPLGASKGSYLIRSEKVVKKQKGAADL